MFGRTPLLVGAGVAGVAAWLLVTRGGENNSAEMAGVHVCGHILLRELELQK